MSSKKSTVDFLLDQLSSVKAASAKRMFGEYAICHGDKVVALVCDDQLFLKPTPAGKALLGECREGAPYPGAKPCLVVPSDLWDDHELLSELIERSAAQLPSTKKKAAKKSHRAG